MTIIDADLQKLLLQSSIYDSKEPLIEFCKNDKIFIELLMELKNNFHIVDTLRGYGTMINLIRAHPSEEHRVTFTPSNVQESFRLFLISWGRLGAKKVPLSEWIDLAEEAVPPKN